MAEARIQLLGGFALALDGELVEPSAWRLRKARSLVKLMALEPGRRLHRDRACETLWPDRPPDAAANNLHQVLHNARRALAGRDRDRARTIPLENGLLVLLPEHRVRIDVEEFERLAGRARATGEVGAIRAALAAYVGDLLPEDAYEEWARARRIGLREARIELLVALADHEARHGDRGAALAALREAVREDELHEPAHRGLMRLLAQGGRRQEALAQYERLRDALRDEYGADPDPETRTLFRELLASSLELTQSAPEPSPASSLRPHGGARHNLSLETSTFVGRAREIAEVERLADRTRLLTLIGTGGAGKTRLAERVAARRVDRHADGVWLVALAPIADPELVPRGVAAALGLELPDRGAASGAELARLIGDGDLLLVLDNCEHLITASAALATDLLRRCPRVAVLATSREPLRLPGELAWRVPSLEMPDAAVSADPERLAGVEAVQLFVQRAAEATPGFRLDAGNAAAIGEICFRLDGMPLALELAAARTPLLAPAQLAGRLGSALDTLGGSRAPLTRHQTLRGALAWSHDLLAEKERVLFRRLAVFAGSFSLEALEGVGAGGPLPEGEVLGVLGRLVDKSLVVVDRAGEHARYRLLETVRQYARERLEKSGEAEAIARRHRRWYLALAEAHDPERQTEIGAGSQKRLDLEHGNLRAALRSALADDPAQALRLAVALWRFWLARGHFAEGTRWLERALAAAPARTALRSRGLFAVLALDVRRGDPSRLERLGDEGVAILEEIGDAGGAAFAEHLTGALAWTRGDGPDAARRLDSAIRAARALRETPTEASALHLRGLVELDRGATGAARERFEAALALLGGLADVRRPFFSVVCAGLAVDPLGPGRVRLRFEETLLHGRRVFATQAGGYVRASLARAARQDGRVAEACATMTQAVEAFAAIGDDIGEAFALGLLGNAERVAGAHDAARAALERSLELRRELGDQRAIAITTASLGMLDAARGELDRALERLTAAERSLEGNEDVPGLAGVMLNRGVVLLDAGDAPAARPLLDAARAYWQAVRAPIPVAWIDLMLAEAATAMGDGAEADRRVAAARDVLARNGHRAGLALIDVKAPLSGG